MKTNFIYSTGVLLLMILIVSCNPNFNKAITDIKKNQINSMTVSNLEATKAKNKETVQCYYQLARIYQYNANLQNLDKSKDYYEYLVKHYYDASLKKEFEQLKKNDGADRSSFESALKNVIDLIDTRTFNSYIKINTLESYKEFVTKYPNSNHLTDAKNKAFDKTCIINTLEGYKDFIEKFPYHKTTEAKEKAYSKTVLLNTLEDYKTYLADFQEYRKDDTYLNAFKITEGLNTINDYNFYLNTFPNSSLKSKAIQKRDLIIVSDFIKSISNQSVADQFAKVDNFLYNNPGNVQNDVLTKHAGSILPRISSLTDFQNMYSALKANFYQTEAILSILNDYFGNSVLNVFDINDSYKTIMNSYSNNYASFKPVLENRLQTYSTILSSYNLPSATVAIIKKKQLNEEFVLQYYPLKQIVENRASYDDTQNRANASAVRSLLNNSVFTSCDDWSTIESFFENQKISITCKTCNGSGSVPEKRCMECKGRGEIRCNNCVQYSETTPGSWVSSGTTNYFTVCCTAGKLHHDSPYVDKVCILCNGQGRIDCPKCGGTGFISECPTCKGKGGYDEKYYDFYK